MKYGSICSGIEAASVAWEPLSWEPVWFSEINPFCNKVLRTHWPNVENLGSLLNLKDNKVFKEEEIDLIVGGTPCQSFSLAGERSGLNDSRGDLTLEYIRCIKEKRPRWFVWENVPGVLSIDRGRTFGTILRKMVELGYGVAYRILDAKNFGLPQSRPRVFVVGHSGGDETIPARVLCIESSCHNYTERSDNEAGRIPTLTLRNAGNKNARGVAVIEVSESFMRQGESSRPETNQWRIRRCTPKEEEKRQGFSGDHTRIDGFTDSERYESIGNSMAVPVMNWIGKQIQLEDDMARAKITNEIREQIILDKENGLSNKDIVEKYSISYSSAAIIGRKQNSIFSDNQKLIVVTPVSDELGAIKREFEEILQKHSGYHLISVELERRTRVTV